LTYESFVCCTGNSLEIKLSVIKLFLQNIVVLRFERLTPKLATHIPPCALVTNARTSIEIGNMDPGTAILVLLLVGMHRHRNPAISATLNLLNLNTFQFKKYNLTPSVRYLV